MSGFSGFGPPRTQRGRASLYGPPPWHMFGRVFTIWYRLEDPGEARRHIVHPLEVPLDPLCRARFYDITHDAGMGDDLPTENPEQTHFHEAVIAVEVNYQALRGDYSIHMYADDPTYIAWGREVYGWPLKMGKINMTRPWHDPQPGDKLTGTLERFGARLMTAQIELDAPVSPDEFSSPLPANWFGNKVIPSITQGQPPDVNQLVVAGPERVEVGQIWQASGSVSLGEGLNDELHFLRPREIVSADYMVGADLRVGFGRILEHL